eukprot:7140744-Heterocapsa_arctica.AAC.1
MAGAIGLRRGAGAMAAVRRGRLLGEVLAREIGSSPRFKECLTIDARDCDVGVRDSGRVDDGPDVAEFILLT